MTDPWRPPPASAARRARERARRAWALDPPHSEHYPVGPRRGLYWRLTMWIRGKLRG